MEEGSHSYRGDVAYSAWPKPCIGKWSQRSFNHDTYIVSCLTTALTYAVSKSIKIAGLKTMKTDDPPRRTGLTRARIIEVAIALADARGVESLSMRALAKESGVEAMSLYNHIRNKDDLLDAVVDTVVGSIDLPGTVDPWQNEMRRRAHSMRAVFLIHPWVPPLIVGRINVGPNSLALMDATLGCLCAAGFSHVQADHVMNALDSFIYGFHLLERCMPVQPENYAEAARTYLPAIDADRYPHFSALGELVAEGSYDGMNRMTFGLDLLLGALEAHREG